MTTNAPRSRLVIGAALLLCACAAEGRPGARETTAPPPPSLEPAEPTMDAPGSGSGSGPGEDAMPMLDPTPAGQAQPGGDAHSLCPSCRSMPGGQTGDFGSGSTIACTFEEIAASGELAQRYRVDEIANALAAPLSFPLYFLPSEDRSAIEGAADTALDLDVELGAFSYHACSDSVAWPGYATAPAMLTFSTRDGTLRGETTAGELFVQEGSLTWSVTGRLDLSAVEGTLELPVDESRIHDGSLSLGVNGSAAQLRASLYARIGYYTSEEAYAQWVNRPELSHPSPAPPEEHELVFARSWSDACGPTGTEVEPDAPHVWLGERSLSTLFAAFVEQVGQRTSTEARWRDGTRTDVSVDFGAAPNEAACVVVSHDRARIQFASSTARVRTDDGRLDAPLRTVTLNSVGGSGEPSDLLLQTDVAPGPPASFEAASGVAGADVSSRAEVGASIEVSRSAGPLEPTIGLLEVFDSMPFDCLIWPAQDNPYEILCPEPE